MTNVKELLKALNGNDKRALARCISLVENDAPESLEILKNLAINKMVPVTGITGPPGAGKSTLTGALIASAIKVNPDIKIAVLAVDPTSPFTHGSLLGDRLRLSEYFNHPNVFIRSIATRGALGGLSAKAIEITDVLRAAGFDHIFVETVGVGQSEVEIASLADTTIVVFVPESGDDIQTIKSGIMEIADVFVVNKADRDGADQMVKNLEMTLHEQPNDSPVIPVIKTVAIKNEGVDTLYNSINQNYLVKERSTKYNNILNIKALRLLQNYLLRNFDTTTFLIDLNESALKPDFNLYRFISEKIK